MKGAKGHLPVLSFLVCLYCIHVDVYHVMCFPARTPAQSNKALHRPSGTRTVTFDDIPADAIRSIIASMMVSKQHCRSPAANQIFKKMAPADVFGLLDFSSRLLMPWAGIAFVREAVRDSKDAAFLCKIACKMVGFDGTDEEAAWKEVVDLVCQRMALVVEEAAALPEFGLMSMETLKRVVRYIADGEWSEEIVYHVPRGSQEDHVKSKVNSQGFYLYVEGGQKLPQNVQKFGFHIDLHSTASQNAKTLSSRVLIIADSEIKAKAREGNNFEETDLNRAYDANLRSGWGRSKFFLSPDEERFRHNNFYYLLFRTRTSKLQRQYLALIKYYEKTSGNLPPAVGSSKLQSVLLDAWRYYSKAGQDNLALVLRDYVCRIFKRVLNFTREFFRALTCSELDSVLAQDLLYTSRKEVHVLKVAIDWARHKSSDAGSLKVGDEVRVRQQCAKYEAC
jgi:hypothetical protein